MRVIDYEAIVKNLDDMVNTLEYDSMRSPGKMKVNAPVLKDMLELRDRYAAKLTAKKPTPKKEG